MKETLEEMVHTSSVMKGVLEQKKRNIKGV